VPNLCSSAHERSHLWAAKQKYVTLLLDASDDKAGVENLRLYAKYIQNTVQEVFIFRTSSLECATAAGYFQDVQYEMENLELSECLSISSAYWNPYRWSSQRDSSSLPYRLNLTVSRAVKNVKYNNDIHFVQKN
jgi:hypothetical protein